MRKERNKSKKTTTDQVIRLITAVFANIFFLCVFFHSGSARAQDKTSLSENFELNFEVKNMHLWHGGVVTPGAMFASAMEYNSTDRKFTVGLWGGAGFSGDYKEFSYYTTYRLMPSFSVSLISHNNYSNSEEVDIFSYDKYTSPNFVDIVLEYTLSEQTPLTFYWSTILFGNGGDYEINNDGSVSNSYSNYVELKYQLFPGEKTRLTLFAGGAFSLITQKTFYSDKANLTSFGLTLNRMVQIASANFPVSATALWNAETKVGVLQLGIALF
ncbi:hypothetical protein ACT29H_11545 [Thermophagus sp. OGC60D27]|uniref:hypothetical protein n=1 Tax=Thermophagus sp. OGC60D27 TaxID=3458415 RepID=UPI004037CB30